ncbi:hypothetical protein TUM12370_37000 [Salmonella enterica subsp. enterica serovar Choleraesuis]|nr:hypothetical protein TUM12370_37000 [Salmonella enterica subsp. enterica serovar Choleraesuis]
MSLLITADVFAASVGSVDLLTFSWSIQNGSAKVDSASATPGTTTSSSSPWCTSSNNRGTCGVALAIYNDDFIGGFYVFSSGPIKSYSAKLAADAVNAISGKTFDFSLFGSKVNSSNAKYACLYKYQNAGGSEGYSLMNGPCSGGDIPPTPTPISCDLSLPSGNTIDFGDISAAKFITAGAGNTLAGITPQSRDLRITCSRASSSPAYIRLTTTGNASGQVIVSDNQDVGFVLSGDNGTNSNVLIPNSANSKMVVPFNGSISASAKITALPASVTGNRPTAGKFASTAILSITWN